jgi:hypothetical protein
MPVLVTRRIKLRDLMALLAVVAIFLAAWMQSGPSHDPEVATWRGWVADLSEKARALRSDEARAMLKNQPAEAFELAKRSEVLEARYHRANRHLAGIEAACCRLCWVRSWFR